MKNESGETVPRLHRPSMVEQNRDEIEDLKEVVKALIKRVHRLELKTGVLKNPQNPWMGSPIPRK